jgi:hypothetical protein
MATSQAARTSFHEWFNRKIKLLRRLDEAVVRSGTQFMPQLVVFSHVKDHFLVVQFPLANFADMKHASWMHRMLAKDVKTVAGAILATEEWTSGGWEQAPARPREAVVYCGMRGSMRLTAHCLIAADRSGIGEPRLVLDAIASGRTVLGGEVLH